MSFYSFYGGRSDVASDPMSENTVSPNFGGPQHDHQSQHPSNEYTFSRTHYDPHAQHSKENFRHGGFGEDDTSFNPMKTMKVRFPLVDNSDADTESSRSYSTLSNQQQGASSSIADRFHDRLGAVKRSLAQLNGNTLTSRNTNGMAFPENGAFKGATAKVSSQHQHQYQQQQQGNQTMTQPRSASTNLNASYMGPSFTNNDYPIPANKHTSENLNRTVNSYRREEDASSHLGNTLVDRSGSRCSQPPAHDPPPPPPLQQQSSHQLLQNSHHSNDYSGFLRSFLNETSTYDNESHRVSSTFGGDQESSRQRSSSAAAATTTAVPFPFRIPSVSASVCSLSKSMPQLGAGAGGGHTGHTISESRSRSLGGMSVGDISPLHTDDVPSPQPDRRQHHRHADQHQHNNDYSGFLGDFLANTVDFDPNGVQATFGGGGEQGWGEDAMVPKTAAVPFPFRIPSLSASPSMSFHAGTASPRQSLGDAALTGTSVLSPPGALIPPSAALQQKNANTGVPDYSPPPVPPTQGPNEKKSAPVMNQPANILNKNRTPHNINNHPPSHPTSVANTFSVQNTKNNAFQQQIPSSAMVASNKHNNNVDQRPPSVSPSLLEEMSTKLRVKLQSMRSAYGNNNNNHNDSGADPHTHNNAMSRTTDHHVKHSLNHGTANRTGHHHPTPPQQYSQQASSLFRTATQNAIATKNDVFSRLSSATSSNGSGSNVSSRPASRTGSRRGSIIGNTSSAALPQHPSSNSSSRSSSSNVSKFSRHDHSAISHHPSAAMNTCSPKQTTTLKSPTERGRSHYSSMSSNTSKGHHSFVNESTVMPHVRQDRQQQMGHPQQHHNPDSSDVMNTSFLRTESGSSSSSHSARRGPIRPRSSNNTPSVGAPVPSQVQTTRAYELLMKKKREGMNGGAPESRSSSRVTAVRPTSAATSRTSSAASRRVAAKHSQSPSINTSHTNSAHSSHFSSRNHSRSSSCNVGAPMHQVNGRGNTSTMSHNPGVGPLHGNTSSAALHAAAGRCATPHNGHRNDNTSLLGMADRSSRLQHKRNAALNDISHHSNSAANANTRGAGLVHRGQSSHLNRTIHPATPNKSAAGGLPRHRTPQQQASTPLQQKKMPSHHQPDAGNSTNRRHQQDHALGATPIPVTGPELLAVLRLRGVINSRGDTGESRLPAERCHDVKLSQWERTQLDLLRKALRGTSYK